VLLSERHERYLRDHKEGVLDSAETFQALLKKDDEKHVENHLLAMVYA
jgi:hypothetical protein